MSSQETLAMRMLCAVNSQSHSRLFLAPVACDVFARWNYAGLFKRLCSCYKFEPLCSHLRIEVVLPTVAVWHSRRILWKDDHCETLASVFREQQ